MKGATSLFFSFVTKIFKGHGLAPKSAKKLSSIFVAYVGRTNAIAPAVFWSGGSAP